MTFKRASFALRRDAGAGHALPKGGPGLGRAHRQRPRAGAQLAADGAGLSWRSPCCWARFCSWFGRSGAATPYIVEVDATGAARAPSGRRSRPTSPATPRSPSIWRASSTTCARSRIDPVVVRQNWLRAYDVVTDRAAVSLNEYARENDPFQRIGRETVAVEVTSVVRASESSFQVRWLERQFDGGALKDTRRLTGLFSIRDHPAAHRRAGAQEPARHLRARLQLVAGRRRHRRAEMTARHSPCPRHQPCRRRRAACASAASRSRKSRSSTARPSRRQRASPSPSPRPPTSRSPNPCRFPASSSPSRPRQRARTAPRAHPRFRPRSASPPPSAAPASSPARTATSMPSRSTPTPSGALSTLCRRQSGHRHRAWSPARSSSPSPPAIPCAGSSATP